jgi:hypothetical protein
MTSVDALLELLGRLGACQETAVLVNDEELLLWPKAAVNAMKSQKLIVKARPAVSAICTGCEYNCAMPVHALPATAGHPSSFIVCDKRSDVNRVSVPSKRLIQWQCNADLVCSLLLQVLAFANLPGKKIVLAGGKLALSPVTNGARCYVLKLPTH